MLPESIEFEDLAPLKERLSFFAASEDEAMRHEAETVARELAETEGNLQGTAGTLVSGVWPRVGKFSPHQSEGLQNLLEGLTRSTEMRPAVEALVAFSQRFQRLRSGVETTQPRPASGELSLAEIRARLEAQKELCQLYADYFALLMRSVSSQDVYTQALEIGSRSELAQLLEPPAPIEPPPLPEETPVVPKPIEPPPLPPEETPVTQMQTPIEPPPLPPEETSVAQTQTPIEPPPPPPSASPVRSGKCADVVFVVDASGSMRTCFDQLRANLRQFVEPFREEGFDSLRLGLLAYSANINRTTKVCEYRNIVLEGDGAAAMHALYGATPRADAFFTRSQNGAVETDRFLRRLDGIRCKGDEDTVFALDCAADFPFGPLETTRRVVVLFTDEKIEDGVLKAASVGENFSQLEKVMKKVVDSHISLYVFAPASPATDMMSEFSRVFMTAVPEFRPDGTDTWASIDFTKVLESMGKSVSASASGGTEKAVARAVFGQDGWKDDRWA